MKTFHFLLQRSSGMWLVILAVVSLMGVEISEAGVRTQDSLSVHDVRVEYFEDPIGINTTNPRLTWKITSNQRGATQQAYRVLVASSPEKLAQGTADLWDSGKVSSDKSVNVCYKGEPLESHEQAYWKVRVWDEEGRVSEWSDVGRWKMGILDASEWHGRWIGSDLPLKPYQDTLRSLGDFERVPRRQIWQWSSRIRKMTRDVGEAPAVYMRKEFEAGRSVKEAYVSVSGLGLYELYINGERAGNYLNPAYTDYEKRVLYNTFEVTDQLRRGKNAIGVVLGNGWYNLIIPHALRYYAADYIAPPKLKMQLRITYDGGSTRTIASDTTWRFTTDGPVRFNDVLGGETYDANKAVPGWKKVDYDDSGWQQARTADAPKGELRTQMLHPVQKVDTLRPRSVSLRGDTVSVDFGKELTGWVRLRLDGDKGDTVTIRHPGAPQHTLGRYQIDKYILDGKGPKWFEPRFSYKGFQRLVITGLGYKPNPADFKAIRVQTDLPSTGSFTSSSEKLNKLQEITRYTIQNYNVHMPNDPTREKAGWTQDVQNAFDAYAYNFDAAAMYQKWQQDMLDIQYESGYVPPVAPGRFDGHHINGPWWGGMIVYLPWKLYRYYGDRQMLEKSYPSMKRYMGYLDRIADSGIVEWGLGDWREPNTPGTNRPQHTPVRLTSTVAYYNYANITAKIADILGDSSAARRYRRKAADIKEAYNKTFYNASGGTYASGSQASQVLSLYFGLVSDSEREKVRGALAERVRGDSLHLNTGFVATPYLLNGLTEMGYPQMAYEIATNETYPGWFDVIFNRNHTVLKESWRGGGVQMPSLAGSITWYFYRSLAGIRPIEEVPAFKEFVIEPAVADDLEWVEASYESMYGTIRSSWKKKGEMLQIKAEIPPNTKARIMLPTENAASVRQVGQPASQINFQSPGLSGDKVTAEVGSGQYHFVIQNWQGLGN